MISAARTTQRKRFLLGLSASLALPLLTPVMACAEDTAHMKHSLVERVVVETASGPMMEDLQSLLRWTRERNRPYITPRADELGRVSTAAVTLFGEVRDGRCTRAIPIFKEAGFEISLTSLGGGPAFAVREMPGFRRGGGVYIVRHGAVPRERIIEVPHSFFDVGTLEIGTDMANIAQARALFVNTVHRYQGWKPPSLEEQDREQQVSPCDVAHQSGSFFQRMTISAMAALPQLQIIQVHGFGDGAVPENAQALVVVSPGTATAGAPEAARVAARLGNLFGTDRVLLYPRDTRKFGAQTNVQSHAVAATRTATFLHLELSRTLRTRLLSDSALRRAFIIAVTGEGGEKP